VVAVTAPSNLPKRLVAGASWTSPGRPRSRATVALALRRTRRREGEVFRRIPRLVAPVSLKHSPSDTAGETALHVIPFRCLHLGLSGWSPAER